MSYESKQFQHIATLSLRKQEAQASGLGFDDDEDFTWKMDDGQWPKLSQHPQGGRWLHAAVALPNSNESVVVLLLVLLGGQDENCGALKSVIVLVQEELPSSFSFSSSSPFQQKKKQTIWRDGPDLNEERWSHAAVVVHAVVHGATQWNTTAGIYVMGGYKPGTGALDTIEFIPMSAFTTTATTTTTTTTTTKSHDNKNKKSPMKWTTLPCRLSCKRDACAAVVVQNRFLVVMGGKDQSSYWSSVDVIDTAANVLMVAVTAGPTMNMARCLFGAAVVTTKVTDSCRRRSVLWAVGGLGKNAKKLNTIESIELNMDWAKNVMNAHFPFLSSSSSWMVHKDLELWTAQSHHSLVSIGSCLVVAAGCSTNSLTSVQVIDTRRGVIWSLPDLTVPRKAASLVLVSNQLVALGGVGRDTVESITLFDETEHFQKLYERALQEGSHRPDHLRVMICGPYGVGKTNCIRLLQNKAFNPNYESTQGIDNQVGRIDEHRIGHQQQQQQQQQQHGMQESIVLSQTLGLKCALHNYVQQESTDHKSSHQMDVHTPPKIPSKEIRQPESCSSQQCGLESMPKSQKLWFLNFSFWKRYIQQNQNTSPLVVENNNKVVVIQENQSKETFVEAPSQRLLDVIRKAQDKKRAEIIKLDGMTLTVWDFAGQVEYHSMQQMFFSNCCLYLLVMNLQLDEDRNPKVGSVDKMLLDAQLWLNAIVSSAGPKIGLLVVGTHADYFASKEEAKSRFHLLLEQLKDRTGERLWNDTLQHARNVVVDNKSGLGADVLRNHIFTIARELSNDLDKIPLRWLRLNEKMQDLLLLESDNICLSLDKIQGIAVTMSFEPGENTELTAALSFLDKMGEIVYILEDGLDQWVFPKPQKLLVVLKSLLAPAVSHEQPDSLSSSEWKEYTESAVLSNKALLSLWGNFSNHDQLRRLLTQSGVIMDLGDSIAIPSLLPKSKSPMPCLPYHKNDGTHLDLQVQTVCGTHVPHSLYPYVLSQLHREIGREDVNIGMMTRTFSVLRLDHNKGSWANKHPNARQCYLALEEDRLQHSICLTIRLVCKDNHNSDDEEVVVDICEQVMLVFHKSIVGRFKSITLESYVTTTRPCADLGRPHTWCILKTTAEVVTMKVSRLCPDYCSKQGYHSVSEAVSEVIHRISENREVLEAAIKRALKEWEEFQPDQWGTIERWDTKKCDLADAENELANRVADLYRDLLTDDTEHVRERKKQEYEEKKELLRQAVSVLEKVYLRLATPNASDQEIKCEHVAFLSHRGEENIKSYVARIQEKLQDKHQCPAFFDRKSMSPMDMPNEAMIRTVMTCRIGVVTLIKGYFASKWCLREFGIFVARRKLELEKHGSSGTPSLGPSFVMVVDAFEKEAIDLTIPGTAIKLPLWDIPQAVRRQQELSFDHAVEVVAAIVAARDLQDKLVKVDPSAGLVHSPSEGERAPSTETAASKRPGVLVRLQTLERSLGATRDSRVVFHRIAYLERICGLRSDPAMEFVARIAGLEQILERASVLEDALGVDQNGQSANLGDTISSFEEQFGLTGKGLGLADRVVALEAELRKLKIL